MESLMKGCDILCVFSTATILLPDLTVQAYLDVGIILCLTFLSGLIRIMYNCSKQIVQEYCLNFSQTETYSWT